MFIQFFSKKFFLKRWRCRPGSPSRRPLSRRVWAARRSRSDVAALDAALTPALTPGPGADDPPRPVPRPPSQKGSLIPSRAASLRQPAGKSTPLTCTRSPVNQRSRSSCFLKRFDVRTVPGRGGGAPPAGPYGFVLSVPSSVIVQGVAAVRDPARVTR